MTDAAMQEVTAGYDPDFLDIAIGMPQPRGPHRLTALPYLRFSVILDTVRRLAAVTGVNIDGSTLQDLPRTGDWDLDPRVPASEQAGPAVYADNDLDRGHLVRRRDPGWGTLAQARAATEATFVYTNAAPQASVFNQSKDLWVGLEDHVLQFADATEQRVSVFTGPVLEADRSAVPRHPDPPSLLEGRRVDRARGGRRHRAGSRRIRPRSDRAHRPEHHRRRPAGLVPHVPGADRRHRARWPTSTSACWCRRTSCR